MAQKIFYELLRPLPTHTELPPFLKKRDHPIGYVFILVLLCWYLFFFLDFKATTEYLSCYKPNTILQYTQSSEYPI